MRRPVFLYLSADGLACEAGSARLAPASARFEGESGPAGFAAWLQTQPADTAFSLLIDLPDEAFQLETLPFVRGTDRQRLLARRQEQLFPDNPCVTHLSLGRDSGGRRDERVLIAAITRPAAVTAWLSPLESAGCVIGGVLSVPFLTMALAAALPAAPQPVLLAHLTPAGLRVSCFDDGRLRFSRLSAAEARGLPLPAERWREEIQRSYQYLVGQRVLSRALPCRCFVLAAADDADALLAALPEGPELQFARVPAGALPACRPGEGGGSLAPLFDLLAAAPRVPQFTSPAALRRQRLHRIGKATVALGLAGLVLGCGLAAANLLATQQFHAQLALTTRELAVRTQRLERLLAALPATPLPLAQLRRTVTQLETLEAGAGGPDAALHQLADALDRLPHVELRQLDWSIAEGTPPSDVLVLDFSLPAGPDDARLRVSEATQILATLRRIPATSVEAGQLPAEMNPGQRLRAAQADASGPAARLVVQLRSPHTRP